MLGFQVYGAAVTFYELFANPESLSAAEAKALGLHLKKKRLVHVNKAICMLSKRPFFAAFKKFLQFLHRETLNRELKELPIERLVYLGYCSSPDCSLCSTLFLWSDQ